MSLQMTRAWRVGLLSFSSFCGIGSVGANESPDGLEEVLISGHQLEQSLPQAPGGRVVGAHFDIVSTGHSARQIVDRQRAGVMWTLQGPAGTPRVECEPLMPRHCYAADIPTCIIF